MNQDVATSSPQEEKCRWYTVCSASPGVLPKQLPLPGTGAAGVARSKITSQKRASRVPMSAAELGSVFWEEGGSEDHDVVVADIHRLLRLPPPSSAFLSRLYASPSSSVTSSSSPSFCSLEARRKTIARQNLRST
ncbi:unnamed protein product, partial [Ixodes pacificus]